MGKLWVFIMALVVIPSLVMAESIVSYASEITSASNDKFNLTQTTYFGIGRNIVYVTVCDKLDKAQYINISNIFSDTFLNQKIKYNDILIGQQTTQYVYDWSNVSIGKYKSSNYTIDINGTRHYRYFDDDVNETEMFCDYVLGDKSCLVLSYVNIRNDTVYDYVSLPAMKEKIAVDGIKIEQKSSGIPLPKGSCVNLQYSYDHPLAWGMKVSEEENKYNISVVAADGSTAILDPTWWNASYPFRSEINCSKLTSNRTDIIVNGTTGVVLNGTKLSIHIGTQYCWENTETYLYYYNNSIFDVVFNGSIVPFDEETYGRFNDYTSTYSNNVVARYYTNATDMKDRGPRGNNLTNAGITASNRAIVGNNSWDQEWTGATDAYDTSFVHNITREYTVSFWLNPEQCQNGAYPFHIHDSSEGRMLCRIRQLSTCQILLEETNQTASSYCTTNFDLGDAAATTWTWITVSRGKDAVEGYMNGTSHSTSNTACDFWDNAFSTLRIGYYSGTSNSFDGAIDDMRVYNISWTDAEVTEVFNNAINTAEGYGNLEPQEDAGILTYPVKAYSLNITSSNNNYDQKSNFTVSWNEQNASSNFTFWDSSSLQKRALLAYSFNANVSSSKLLLVNHGSWVYNGSSSLKSNDLEWTSTGGLDGTGMINKGSTTGYLNTTSNENLTRPFTACVNFRVTGGAWPSGGNAGLLSKWDSGGGRRSWMVWVAGNGSYYIKMASSPDGSAIDYAVYPGAGISISDHVASWWDVCAVFSNTSNKLYVNGSLAAEETISSTTIYSSNETIVSGAFPSKSGYANNFDGLLDNVMIYNWSLSSKQIQERYDAIVGKRPQKLIRQEVNPGENWNATVVLSNLTAYNSDSTNITINTASSTCSYVPGTVNWVVDCVDSCNFTTTKMNVDVNTYRQNITNKPVEEDGVFAINGTNGWNGLTIYFNSSGKSGSASIIYNSTLDYQVVLNDTIITSFLTTKNGLNNTPKSITDYDLFLTCDYNGTYKDESETNFNFTSTLTTYSTEGIGGSCDLNTAGSTINMSEASTTIWNTFGFWFNNTNDITSATPPYKFFKQIGALTYYIMAGTFTSDYGATNEVFTIGQFTTGNGQTYTSTIPAGRHMIVFKHNGARYEGWLDGVNITMVKPGAYALMERIRLPRISIGEFSSGYNHMTAKIDGFFATNRNLTSEEIIELYANGINNLTAGGVSLDAEELYKSTVGSSKSLRITGVEPNERYVRGLSNITGWQNLTIDNCFVYANHE